MKEPNKQLYWWAALTMLLLLTFSLRTWNLLEVPPGLTHDEASNAFDASGILKGHHAIYFPSGYGHEPLYDYSVALFTLMMGESIFTLRYTSVIWGLITWALTVALARRWWGRSSALIAGVMVALSFWAQMMARVGLRGPVLPALFTASMLLFERGSSQSRNLNTCYIASGLCLGAGYYTYMASRGLFLVYVLFLLSHLFVHHGEFRRIWRGTCIVVGISFLVGLPLFLHLWAYPELEQRVAQLGGAITTFFDGNWQPLLQNISDSLPLMLWRADPRWLYNIAGRAALEPLFAVLFCVGVITCLLQLTEKRARLLLFWLGVGTAPALLTHVEYNTLHAIAAMPAAFLCATFGLQKLTSALSRGKFRIRIGTGLIFILTVLFCLTGIESMNAYFVHWKQNRDVRVAYHHHVVTLGRQLYHSDDTSPAVITSLYPGQYHDPYTMDITLRNRHLPLRWVDGRSAVFVPHGTARLYVEEQTVLPFVLWELIEPDTFLVEELTFNPDDIPSWIKLYRWDSQRTWERLLPGLRNEFYIDAENGNTGDLDGVANPVIYDAVVQLVGYHVLVDNSIQVLTAWSVLNSPELELNIFVHLLDAEGTILSQEDYLGAPSWQWETGDRFLHLHTLSLPAGGSLQFTRAAIGVYQKDTGTRLRVVQKDTDIDYILLRLDT